MTSNGSIPFTKLAASDWQSWFIPAEAITHKAQNRLDGGGFADVFAARLGNMDVAVKQLRIHLNNYGIDVFEREIRVWHRLKHVNILPLLGACDRDAQGTPIPPFMVSPLMENGSMLEYIKKNQCYLNQKLSFLAQSAAGMNYLHSERIIHGDFKTANVLLDGRLNAVVADFGMSRTKRTSASAVWVRASPFEGGTPGFIAPEMLDPNDPAGASKKTDVYAFAITMYEVLNDGKEIWVTRDGQIMQIFQIGLMVCNGRRPKRIPGIPDDVWALIERCWAHDPADRPSFPEILAVLQPYNRVSTAAIKSPSVSLLASHLNALSLKKRPIQSQPSRSAELKFDDIELVFHLPDSLVSRAKQGDPDACLEAAKLVSEGLPAHHQDWKPATQLYKAAADRGKLEASFQLARLAFLGEGMMQSDRSAFWFWQEVSTKSTDAVLKPIATHIVGWMHYLGRGTQLDKQKGIKIIRENSTNEFKLGEDECLAGGTGCSSNSPAACKFFDLCQQGSDRDWLCRHLMAVCLFLGFGTTQDRKKAVSIFEQLANKGHSDSRLWIGKCFMGIEEVPEDLRKAFEWFFKSATEGNPYGQWMVGECFSNGWGVTKDIAKAFEWYGKSAENGNRSGQFYVGCCYEFETGVSKNLDTAIFWYRKSAKQGYQVAINSLKYLGKWP